MLTPVEDKFNMITALEECSKQFSLIYFCFKKEKNKTTEHKLETCLQCFCVESIKYLPHGQLWTVPCLCKGLSNKSCALEVLLRYWLFRAHEKVIAFISGEEKKKSLKKNKANKKKTYSLKAREEEMACRAQRHPSTTRASNSPWKSFPFITDAAK